LRAMWQIDFVMI